MNCAFDKEKLSAFYDGELAAGEKAEVERHIASCSECLRDLGELKSAALLVKELPRLRAPKSIAEGVSREIRSAGQVHSLAKFRRLVLWASAAAAGLFIVTNAMYLTGQKSPAPAANEAPMARSVAKVQPSSAEEPAAAPRPPEPSTPSADRALREDKLARRQEEARKNGDELQEKRIAAKPAEEAKKLDANAKEAGAPAGPKPVESLTKAAEPKADAPVPPAAVPPPAPTAKSAAPAPAPEAPKPAAPPLAEKAAGKEADAERKPEPELKSKVAVVGAAAELPPVQFNVVTTQIAKARPRIEDSLKKMGLPVPPPAAQPMKQPRNREADNTLVLELTDAQLLKLRDELEKPGDARMVASQPLDPVLPGFRGGLFGKKEASGGASVAGRAPAAKDKDGKELDDAAKAPAEQAAAPRRRVTLHLVESKNLPPAEGEAVPAQKN